MNCKNKTNSEGLAEQSSSPRLIRGALASASFPPRSFFIPQYKWQLIQWLSNRYPETNFKNMSKKRLYAIYYNRRRNG